MLPENSTLIKSQIQSTSKRFLPVTLIDRLQCSAIQLKVHFDRIFQPHNPRRTLEKPFLWTLYICTLVMRSCLDSVIMVYTTSFSIPYCCFITVNLSLSVLYIICLVCVCVCVCVH